MPIRSIVRTLRLVAGLILMAFVVSHLGNLALGLHSLDAMQRWLPTLMGPWQSGVGAVLLPASMLVHVLLGLVSIASRHSLAMSRTDVVQLVLGLLTPPLLLNHTIAMGMTANLVSEFEPSYGQILAVYWKFAPTLAFQQLFAVIFVWIHGAIGLYTWLVLKPIWKRIGAVVLPLLFVVPVAALLGFAEAGKEVLGRLATDAAWREGIEAMIALARPVKGQLDALQARILIVYGVLFLLALAVYGVRRLRTRLMPVRVAYDGGELATGRRGLSILELSRINGIAHADVCSGRGRCGTCRVHVESGGEHLSPRNDIEAGTLARVGAGEHDRLACQARVLASGVRVTRLLPSFADATAARQPAAWVEGIAAGHATNAANPLATAAGREA